eukprot:3936605-Rhodomonas_salina.2
MSAREANRRGGAEVRGGKCTGQGCCNRASQGARPAGERERGSEGARQRGRERERACQSERAREPGNAKASKLGREQREREAARAGERESTQLDAVARVFSPPPLSRWQPRPASS